MTALPVKIKKNQRLSVGQAAKSKSCRSLFKILSEREIRGNSRKQEQYHNNTRNVSPQDPTTAEL